MKKILLTLVTLGFISINIYGEAQPLQTKTIGILVPLEHQAMTEIVSGFKQELKKKYSGPVNVEVKNAEHDINLEHSILKQFSDRSMDVVAPIGTDAMEMSVAMIKHTPIIGIAADFDQRACLSHNNCHATDILDEVNPSDQIRYIHQVMPNLKYLTLIHSADNKIIPEVIAVKKVAALYGIKVQDLMAQEEPELYVLSKNIDKKSQAIFILKDHMIVNAIATLTKQAEALKIPLISSDDGSVSGGSAFAIGVRERQIGIVAADITAKVLQGTAAQDIPMQRLTHYHVFINKDHALKQGVNLQKLESIAHKDGYNIVYLGGK